MSVHQHDEDGESLKRGIIALLLALALQVAILAAIVLVPTPHRVGPRVSTRMISQGEFNANRHVLSPEQQARRQQLEEALKKKHDEAQEKKIEKELAQLKGQIVDLPGQPNQPPPDQAKFLSEFNTKVEKESKSRFRTPDYKRAANEPTQASKNAQAQQAPPPPLGGKGGAPGKEQEAKAGKTAAMETERKQQRDRLELALDPSLGAMRNQEATEQVAGNSNRFRQEEGQEAQDKQGGSGPIGPTEPIRVPNMGVLAKMSGAPANDFLPDDIADGEGTFLNSREFKFAPFFNRLKQTVSEHWRPLDELKRRDPTMNIYGGQARTTVVDVVLAQDGSLKSISVQKSCGVDFLDQEAMQAFQRAQPFPNPPKQLVKNGMVEFPFGFHVEFSARMF